LNRFAIFFDSFLAALAFTGATLIVGAGLIGACVGLGEDFAFLLFLPALVIIDGLAEGLAVGLVEGLAVMRSCHPETEVFL
jgi:Na+-transporting NADH:ubiquinone oxidoreductase subunit NqrD